MVNPASKQESGMTLLEILLYVSISGAILFAAASLLTTIYEVKQKGHTIQAVEEEGSIVSYTIQRYLQNADKVTVVNTGEAVEKLTVNVITNNKESVVTLYAKDGVLYAVIDNATTPLALTSGDVLISSLAFNYSGGTGAVAGKGFISYAFTATSSDKTGRNSYTKTFQGGVSVR